MKNMLLSSASDFLSSYGLIILLAVLLIGVIFISYNRRKNDELKRQQLNNEIKPGVKVLTYHGVYGEVVSLTNTTDGIQVVIKTGDDKHASYEKIHINAICSIDQSTVVVLDAEGNPITKETTSVPEEPVIVDTKVEDETKVEEKPTEVAVEEKPKKKTVAKKSTKKEATDKAAK